LKEKRFGLQKQSMWVIHTPTSDQGIYLSSVDNDHITVWSKMQKTVCTWKNCDLEVVLDYKDSDDFTDLLRIMVSKHGKDTFERHTIVASCLNAIEFYMKEENLAFENFETRLKTMQEVLYYALGDRLELSEERDRILLFIHGTLPNMMIGALVGYRLGLESAKDDLDDIDDDSTDSQTQKTHALAPRRRWCLC
jgi:hypothetical protein